MKSVDDYLYRRRKPLKLYYFSYGYSSNPVSKTMDVQRKVREILKKRNDIVPIIPHFLVDCFLADLNSGFVKNELLLSLPNGYSHPEASDWEVEIISRCDALVYDPLEDSVGVRWEVAIARKLGVPVYTYDEVLNGDDLCPI